MEEEGEEEEKEEILKASVGASVKFRSMFDRVKGLKWPKIRINVPGNRTQCLPWKQLVSRLQPSGKCEGVIDTQEMVEEEEESILAPLESITASSSVLVLNVHEPMEKKVTKAQPSSLPLIVGAVSLFLLGVGSKRLQMA